MHSDRFERHLFFRVAVPAILPFVPKKFEEPHLSDNWYAAKPGPTAQMQIQRKKKKNNLNKNKAHPQMATLTKPITSSKMDSRRNFLYSVLKRSWL